MTLNRQKIAAMFFFGIFAVANLNAGTVWAQGGGGSGRGGHQGPPEEAFTACEDKSEGDTASFESPRGETVVGTCMKDRRGDKLVLVPDDMPEHSRPDNDEN